METTLLISLPLSPSRAKFITGAGRVTGKRVGETILQLRIKAYQVPTSSVSVVVSPLEVVSPIVKIPFTAYLEEI